MKTKKNQIRKFKKKKKKTKISTQRIHFNCSKIRFFDQPEIAQLKIIFGHRTSRFVSLDFVVNIFVWSTRKNRMHCNTGVASCFFLFCFCGVLAIQTFSMESSESILISKHRNILSPNIFFTLQID